MSTQRPREEHGLLAWFLGIMRHEAPQSTGWQRHLHQREDPIYGTEPDVPMGGLRQSAWVDQQMRIAGVVPPQQTGEMAQLPPVRVTDAMPRLSAHPPISAHRMPSAGREWADVDTARKLARPAWLLAVLDGNRLPVERPHVVESVAQKGQIATNTGALDDMLLTLRPARDRYRLDKPAYPDLPTVPSQSRLIEQTMEALPPAAEDFPRWLTADPPTLIPLPVDVIASTDRTAVTLFADAVTIHQEEEVTGETPTMHVPAVRERHAIEEIIEKMKGE